MTTLPPIDDVDGFVERVLGVQDPYRIDDDLQELKYVAFTVLANQMVKFSGLFADEQSAVERAKQVALDGLFTSAVAPVGRWSVFGRGMDEQTVEDAVRAFADASNRQTARFKDRLKQTEAPGTDDEEGGDEVVPDTDDEEQPELPGETLRKIRLAVQRGDPKDARDTDQRFVVVGHGKLTDDSCMFRVVGSYETEDEASRAAKRAFDTDRTDPGAKRFDYAVARQYVWLRFPINFATDVADARVEGNPDLEDFYKGEAYKRSDEYKAAVQDIEDTIRKNKEIEAAAPPPEIISEAPDNDVVD